MEPLLLFGSGRVRGRTGQRPAVPCGAGTREVALASDAPGLGGQPSCWLARVKPLGLVACRELLSELV